MIIKSFEIEKLKSLNSNIHLIYGNNDGIKNDIINNFYLKDFKGELLKYDEQDILNDKEKFLSILLNKSLFDDKRIIIISRITNKLTEIIEDIFQIKLLDLKIIIKAPVLEKKSKIRILFEKDPISICTPVYEDDQRSLSTLTNNFLRRNQLKLSQEVINILIERSKGDRSNLRNELSKLENLSMSKKKINIDDVIKLTNLAENYSVFELIDNYLAKNSKKVSNILNENNYSSEDCILIIRTILNKSKRLLKIKKELDENKNIEQIFLSLKPPIFWKEKDIIKKQAQSWSTEEVKKLIFKINNLEALVKKNTINSVLFVSDFISNY
tara:strand:+ start:22 stop:999 length:978 start_codon:yes stop_codon:yes gene_type:complete